MKFLFISFISLLLMSCPSEKSSTTTSASDLPFDSAGVHTDSGHLNQTQTIAGEWELMPVLPSDTATGRIPKLIFDVNAKRFSGNTGCNQMNGSFFLEKDSLVFSKDIALTRMACPGYNERVFLDNLLKANHFRIENGVLELIANGTVLSKWKRLGTIKEKTV